MLLEDIIANVDLSFLSYRANEIRRERRVMLRQKGISIKYPLQDSLKARHPRIILPTALSNSKIQSHARIIMIISQYRVSPNVGFLSYRAGALLRCDAMRDLRRAEQQYHRERIYRS